MKPKLDIGLFADFCVFTRLYQFLHDVHIKLFCRLKKHFYEHIMQELVKMGKYTEINKQSNVKFWLNWIKLGAVSYLLSCTYCIFIPRIWKSMYQPYFIYLQCICIVDWSRETYIFLHCLLNRFWTRKKKRFMPLVTFLKCVNIWDK